MPHKITVLSTNHGFCHAPKMLVTRVKPGKYVTLNFIYFYIDKELCNPNQQPYPHLRQLNLFHGSMHRYFPTVVCKSRSLKIITSCHFLWYLLLSMHIPECLFAPGQKDKSEAVRQEVALSSVKGQGIFFKLNDLNLDWQIHVTIKIYSHQLALSLTQQFSSTVYIFLQQ